MTSKRIPASPPESASLSLVAMMPCDRQPAITGQNEARSKHSERRDSWLHTDKQMSLLSTAVVGPFAVSPWRLVSRANKPHTTDESSQGINEALIPHHNPGTVDLERGSSLSGTRLHVRHATPSEPKELICKRKQTDNNLVKSSANLEVANTFLGTKHNVWRCAASSSVPGKDRTCATELATELTTDRLGSTVSIATNVETLHRTPTHASGSLQDPPIALAQAKETNASAGSAKRKLASTKTYESSSKETHTTSTTVTRRRRHEKSSTLSMSSPFSSCSSSSIASDTPSPQLSISSSAGFQANMLEIEEYIDEDLRGYNRLSY
ncbi:hypothetical protein BGX34_009808 [Mortierella sp. NVP85]|nr:hypothetical protein BGX34_009808 [Mortierella sp. NVP85]